MDDRSPVLSSHSHLSAGKQQKAANLEESVIRYADIYVLGGQWLHLPGNYPDAGLIAPDSFILTPWLPVGFAFFQRWHFLDRFGTF